MKFIDLFAGIGGFRCGMELAGHKCVGFCEWDKYATASYISMHLLTNEQREYLSTLDLKKRQKEILKDEYKNGEWYSNDIRNVDAGSVPKADCWCFGAPCQDFSIAGKRAGLNGDRSSLVREVFRIIGEFEEKSRPEWIIYENVKGMFSSNRGFDYLEILLAMDELGYDCEWQLFNSKDWGVPQNRERVYTVGHLRSRGAAKIFPITGADGENCIQQLGNYLPTRTRANPNQGRIYSIEGIGPCLNKMDGGGREPSVAIPVLTPERTNKQQNGRRFKENEDPMFTLTGQDRHGVGVGIDDICIDLKSFSSSTRGQPYRHGFSATLDHNCYQGIFVRVSDELTIYAIWYEKYQCYIAIRKLTPKECFRLQGWTDDYFEKAQFVNSDSQLYKQAGNGVTVNVVYEIGSRIPI